MVRLRINEWLRIFETVGDINNEWVQIHETFGNVDLMSAYRNKKTVHIYFLK